MSFNFEIPKFDQKNLKVSVALGESLFVLGTNGSGKSSIMSLFSSTYSRKAIRISAHRQNWFSSGGINITAETKRATESNILNYDHSAAARWKDDFSSVRASVALYNLIDSENVRARSITKAVDEANMHLAQELSKKDAPITILNELLKFSNINIEISVRESEQVMASRNGGPHYSVAELSDGERNALLIAASVLTAPKESLILIDEPERHLHRSITSPLLNQMIAKRKDCAFVISTHDVSLALDGFVNKALLLRDCRYSGSTVQAWDADLLDGSSAFLNEEIKRDILGSRRAIIFIEGTDQSLDSRLYSIVFPSTSIIPKSSCRLVDQATTEIREAKDLHWIRAFGIVDNDRRSSKEIEELRKRGVFAISEYSVESIYYHPFIQEKIAERQVSVIGGEPESLLSDARKAALIALAPHAQRMSERVAERAIREEFFKNIPKKSEIATGNPITFNLDIKEILSNEQKRFEEFLKKEELSKLISFYPIRETPALKEIAEKLGFQDRQQYEGAVLKLVSDDTEALNFVKTLFGALLSELSK